MFRWFSKIKDRILYGNHKVTGCGTNHLYFGDYSIWIISQYKCSNRVKKLLIYITLHKRYSEVHTGIVEGCCLHFYMSEVYNFEPVIYNLFKEYIEKKGFGRFVKFLGREDREKNCCRDDHELISLLLETGTSY